MKIPDDSTELLYVLRNMYPPKCILEGQTLESAHRYAGAVELIGQLIGIWELNRDETFKLNDPQLARVERKYGITAEKIQEEG